jgi:hypothetical protein
MESDTIIADDWFKIIWGIWQPWECFMGSLWSLPSGKCGCVVWYINTNVSCPEGRSSKFIPAFVPIYSIIQRHILEESYLHRANRPSWQFLGNDHNITVARRVLRLSFKARHFTKNKKCIIVSGVRHTVLRIKIYFGIFHQKPRVSNYVWYNNIFGKSRTAVW